MGPGPLTGKTILIVRQERQAKGMIDRIQSLGGKAIAVPLLDFALPEDQKELRKKIAAASGYDWLILTSQNAADFFFRLSGETDTLPPIAVIGSKTKEALAKYGAEPDFVPEKYVAESFAAEFRHIIKPGDRVLLPKGNRARNVIAAEIRAAGAECDEVIVYETFCPEESGPALADVLRNRQPDAVAFTSSSTVEFFMDIVNKYGLAGCLQEMTIAAIGPVARKTAETHGLTVHVCPDTYTAGSMIDALCGYWAG